MALTIPILILVIVIAFKKAAMPPPVAALASAIPATVAARPSGLFESDNYD
jgi:hypothetical protein